MNTTKTNSTKQDFIRQLISMGIAVMPLYHRSKEPMLSTWREFQTRLPSEQELSQWFPTDWNNYGIICGWNNLVVIDFDNIEYFNLWQLWHEVNNTQYLLSGFKVRTCHGMHVYLQTMTPSTNDKRISKSGGIDVQAQGKYVVGPLSVHPSEHIYEPIGEFAFPCVESVESVLPLDLFPRVRTDEVVFTGTPIEKHTEYSSDPFTDTRDLISKVKSAVRIESLFRGVQRSSSDGRWLKALCPFHADAHQSAWIDVKRQLAGCQVCGMRPMDVVNLYSRMHNISNADAVQALAEEIGVWR